MIPPKIILPTKEDFALTADLKIVRARAIDKIIFITMDDDDDDGLEHTKYRFTFCVRNCHFQTWLI